MNPKHPNSPESRYQQGLTDYVEMIEQTLESVSEDDARKFAWFMSEHKNPQAKHYNFDLIENGSLSSIAEDMLREEPAGKFLIRPSSDSANSTANKVTFAVTFKVPKYTKPEGQIVHARLQYENGKLTHVTDPGVPIPSIKEWVDAKLAKAQEEQVKLSAQYLQSILPDKYKNKLTTSTNVDQINAALNNSQGKDDLRIRPSRNTSGTYVLHSNKLGEKGHLFRVVDGKFEPLMYDGNMSRYGQKFDTFEQMMQKEMLEINVEAMWKILDESERKKIEKSANEIALLFQLQQSNQKEDFIIRPSRDEKNLFVLMIKSPILGDQRINIILEGNQIFQVDRENTKITPGFKSINALFDYKKREAEFMQSSEKLMKVLPEVEQDWVASVADEKKLIREVNQSKSSGDVIRVAPTSTDNMYVVYSRDDQRRGMVSHILLENDKLYLLDSNIRRPNKVTQQAFKSIKEAIEYDRKQLNNTAQLAPDSVKKQAQVEIRPQKSENNKVKESAIEQELRGGIKKELAALSRIASDMKKIGSSNTQKWIAITNFSNLVRNVNDNFNNLSTPKLISQRNNIVNHLADVKLISQERQNNRFLKSVRDSKLFGGPKQSKIDKLAGDGFEALGFTETRMKETLCVRKRETNLSQQGTTVAKATANADNNDVVIRKMRK